MMDQSIVEILQLLRAILTAGLCGVIAWYFFQVVRDWRSAWPFFAFLLSFAAGVAILRFFVGQADADGGMNLASCDPNTYPLIIVCNGWPLYLETGKVAMETILGLGGHYGGAAAQSALMTAVTLLALYKALAKNVWQASGRGILEAFLLGSLSWIVLANSGWILQVITGAVTYGVSQLGEAAILSDLSAKLVGYQKAIGMAERITDFASIGELQTTKQVTGLALFMINCSMALFNVMTVLNTFVVCLLIILTNYLPSIALLMIVIGSYSPMGLVRLLAYTAIFKLALFVEYSLLNMLPDPGGSALKMLMESAGTIVMLVGFGLIIISVKAVLFLKFVYFIYKREFVPIRSGFNILMKGKP